MVANLTQRSLIVADKIILTACVIDQGDILPDFIEWHLCLGVDRLLIDDLGSTDGSRDILDRMAHRGRVEWSPKTETIVGKHANAFADQREKNTARIRSYTATATSSFAR